MLLSCIRHDRFKTEAIDELPIKGYLFVIVHDPFIHGMKSPLRRLQ